VEKKMEYHTMIFTNISEIFSIIKEKNQRTIVFFLNFFDSLAVLFCASVKYDKIILNHQELIK